MLQGRRQRLLQLYSSVGESRQALDRARVEELIELRTDSQRIHVTRREAECMGAGVGRWANVGFEAGGSLFLMAFIT